jgi:hypothetical protein
MFPWSGSGQSVQRHRVTWVASPASGSSGLACEAAYAEDKGWVGARWAKEGEFGTSPDVSEEIEPEGEGGACMWMSPITEIGVARSYAEAPVRRRFDGGMAIGVDTDGEPVAETVERESSSSSDGTEESGESRESLLAMAGRNYLEVTVKQ